MWIKSKSPVYVISSSHTRRKRGNCHMEIIHLFLTTTRPQPDIELARLFIGVTSSLREKKKRKMCLKHNIWAAHHQLARPSSHCEEINGFNISNLMCNHSTLAASWTVSTQNVKKSRMVRTPNADRFPTDDGEKWLKCVQNNVMNYLPQWWC